MILTFIHTKEDIRKAVEQDTAYLGERTRDANGDIMFQDLVYDQEYEIQFKRFFLEAQVPVIEACSAYLKGIPVGASYDDLQKFDEDQDFILQLAVPDNYLAHMKKVVDIRMRRFLVAHIMFSWLKDKAPNIAQVYSQELVPLLDGIKRSLEARLTPMKTIGRLF